ncbi:MAG: hypothetical protein R3D34_06865 [Nitratireductor sp.]
MAEEKKREPVLDLDALVERRKIRIHGTLYEIASAGELSVIETQRLAAWGRDHDALVKAFPLVPEQEAELANLIDCMANVIMAPVPAEIRASLTQGQKMSVIEVFTALLLQQKVAAAGALRRQAASEPKANPPTSHKTGEN